MKKTQEKELYPVTDNTLILRDYQEYGAISIKNKLKEQNIVYVAWEMRTGKTLTILQACKLYGVKKVLFLTTKKGITGIEKDYEHFKKDYELIIINHESQHKIVDNDFDIVIYDEAHKFGTYPKPSLKQKNCCNRFSKKPIILLSGTPYIESISQIYHQLKLSNYSCFSHLKNFYSFVHYYGIPVIKTRRNGYESNVYNCSKKDILNLIRIFKINNSSKIPFYEDNLKLVKKDVLDFLIKRKKAIRRIENDIEPIFMRRTKKDSGFKSDVVDNVIYFNQSDMILKLIRKLIKDKVIVGNEETILADNISAMKSKIHQLSNGTVIFESGNSKVLDTEKADFIKAKFKGKKMAIFYYYQAEKGLLFDVIGNCTDDINEFNETEKHIVLQQISGSEGINLSKADCLVYYNFGFSGKNYVQGRDRLTTIDREINNVYFIFSKNDINSFIYKSIKGKKNYNDNMFNKDMKSI